MMDMGGTTSSGASSTMDMASSMTSSMAMASSTSSDDMSDSMSMAMYFVRNWHGIPVLFERLKANSGIKAFGIFVLLFFIGICTRGFEFLKNYLEQRVWKQQETYLAVPPQMDQDSKASVSVEHSRETRNHMNVPSSLVKNFIRLVLCFVPEMFGFALMLATMSFTPLYFFAVVSGLAVGRFIFERLSEQYGVQPVAGYHC